MNKWQPFRPTFMPVDFYEDDAKTLNEQGRRFLRSCAMIDVFLLGVTKK